VDGWKEQDLNGIRSKLADFANERDWDQFHTPRNLVLALVGEVGELAEIFQWKGEVRPSVPELSLEEKQHLAEELADVGLYLIRLSDRCGIDLGEVMLSKIAKNAHKYPVDKAKGKSDKYTAYS